jgi:serine phosphatase RsbU (regulator of sigma subunit)
MSDAVRAFRGSAPQSDDITMLALKYLSTKGD